jgi:hypothetical protein
MPSCHTSSHLFHVYLKLSPLMGSWMKSFLLIRNQMGIVGTSVVLTFLSGFSHKACRFSLQLRHLLKSAGWALSFSMPSSYWRRAISQESSWSFPPHIEAPSASLSSFWEEGTGSGLLRDSTTQEELSLWIIFFYMGLLECLVHRITPSRYCPS